MIFEVLKKGLKVCSWVRAHSQGNKRKHCITQKISTSVLLLSGQDVMGKTEKGRPAHNAVGSCFCGTCIIRETEVG